jgi:pSer/pThr/pTyr-binding forkhead associated (FHA) protein
MSLVETSLARLEALLRALIEGEASLSGFPRNLHHQVTRALVRAMHAKMDQQKSRHGKDVPICLAPDLFTIVMPASQASLLVNQPAVLNRLAHKLENSADQAGYQLAGSPILRIVPDPDVKELIILAEYSQGNSHTIEVDQIHASPEQRSEERIPDAFLIVNGVSTFPLHSTVINIGSAPDNQLVLNDPGISPFHAQIRFSSGRFEVFNLDSRQGTYVNGTAVSSRTLNAGDIIRLAGVLLVYGQEEINQLGYTQEIPAEPPAVEVLEG